MTNIQTSEILETEDIDLDSIEETQEAPVEETTENPTEEVVEDPETPEVAEEVQEQEQTPVEVDYKKKFVDSQREAILLAEREKLKEAQLQQLTKQDTPTDEAMRAIYPDWDDLNDVTKRAFTRIEAEGMARRRQDLELEEWRQEKRLNAEIETTIESNPKLAGREAEFKRFASNPKNKGLSTEVLAKAFLYDVEDEKPVTPQRKPVLPTGSGGSREPISNKVSLVDAEKIRKTNPDKWRELAIAGQIEDIE